MHETLQKFNYEELCLYETEHWAVTLRPAQVTLGSLVLIGKHDVKSIGKFPSEAMAEMPFVAAKIEQVLKVEFDANKFNYLALMMVDPQVHYHVIPRYDGVRKFKGEEFADNGWPKLPAMGECLDIDSDMFTKLKDHLKKAFA